MALGSLTVSLVEGGAAERRRGEIESAAGQPLMDVIPALDPLVDVTVGAAPDSVTLRANRHVGSVCLGSLRVDVRPRLAADELATLVRFALGGATESWARSRIAGGRVGLEELIARVFAEELSALRERGVSRLYVTKQESLARLRGRPDFIASFPWNEQGMASLVCRFHELTCDNLDNQLLRGGLDRAVLMETTVPTRRLLLEHLQAWHALTSCGRSDPIAFSRARERYNRLSEHYRLAHHLAELIVNAHPPSSLFASAETPTGGICLDMADLFERFLERLTRELLAPYRLTVRSQESDRRALIDRDGRPYRAVRPDLVVYSEGQPVAVIDAKYKEYWRARTAGVPERRITNGDLYQVFFYAQRLQLRHRLPRPPMAFIVSPLPAPDEDSAPSIGERYRQVRWRAGSDDAHAVSLVLIPLTQLLRRLRCGPLTAEQSAALASQLMPDPLAQGSRKFPVTSG